MTPDPAPSRHYLDYASSAPIRPIAIAAMIEMLRLPAADPGRMHTEALIIREALELARQSVADLCGARASEVVFTSSGTEALVSAVSGSLMSRPGTVIASAVEHSAIRLTAQRADRLRLVPVDGHGRIDPSDVTAAIDDEQRHGRDVSLVACQLANHEVGTIQPVTEIIESSRARGVRTLIDAAAAAGTVEIDMRALGADFLALSGHKIGAPPGTGALLIRRGVRIAPLLLGGEQERARRGGLENTPAAVALGAVCAELSETRATEAAEAKRLTDQIRTALASVPGITEFGHPDHRLAHLVCIGIDDVEPQAIILGLDQRGVAVHSGSACASEGLEPSPVLEAMGVDAHRSLRISVGWDSTDADTDAVIKYLPAVLGELRQLRA